MPNEIHVPDIVDQDFQRRPLLDEEGALSVKDAGNLVLKSFDDAAQYREQHVEPKWTEAEKLYFGHVRRRFWPGTNIPRSSLPYPIVQDQVETVYPEIVGALFGTEPYWFETVAEAGTSAADADAVRARLAFVLEQQGDEDGRTGLSELKRVAKSFTFYGNGYAEVGYDSSARRPYVEWLDIRDVYLPPRAGNWVDAAPYWIKRVWMTVEELKDLRGQVDSDLDIPSDDVLYSLAKNRSYESADMDKVNLELTAGRSSQLDTFNQNPAREDVEVLVYQSKKRIIWVLGRKFVAYNKPNDWGIITLAGAPFMLILGSQYARGLADMVKNEQKLAQGLTNGYLDEIALNLNPPRTALNSALGHPSQLAFRPGNLFRSSQPDKDFIPHFTGQVTRDAWAAVGDVERRANKRSGISEMAQSGVPTPSNANRTATGINSVAGAMSRRLFTPIDNFETYLLVPVLRKLHKIIRLTEGSLEGLPGKAPDGSIQQVSGASAAAPAQFKVLAASKMQARERLAGSLPFIIQYLFNPQLMEQAASQGHATNFAEINRFVQDGTGTRDRYEFFRPMSDEERQALQSQSQQGGDAEMAKEELQAQVRLEVARMKSENEKLKIASDSNISAEKIAVEILKILQAEQAERTTKLLERQPPKPATKAKK